MERHIESTRPSTILGLRYLEEEAVEISSIIGCFVPVDRPIDPGDGGGGETHYVTNCDYSDYD